MNEIPELTRFRETVADDPAARARARDRLVHHALGNRALGNRALGDRPPRVPSRRPARRHLAIATAAAVVVAATVAYALTRPGTGEPEWEVYHPPPIAFEPVVVPMALAVTSNPPPAGEHLREIAAQISDAAYDVRSGEYEYHRYRTWGALGQGSEEGHFMSYVEDFETYVAPDRSVRQRDTFVGAQFLDEASRAYYESAPNPNLLQFPRSYVNAFAPDSDFFQVDEVPTGEAELAELFAVAGGGEFDFGPLQEIYRDHIVPKEARRAVLEVLAGAPGFEWRGEVTDRAGRSGVAISYDTGEPGFRVRWVLVFDPDTGELLSSESVDLRAGQEYLSSYTLYLATAWTDDPGPEPTG